MVVEHSCNLSLDFFNIFQIDNLFFFKFKFPLHLCISSVHCQTCFTIGEDLLNLPGLPALFSVHPWANRKWLIDQSKRTLYLCYVVSIIYSTEKRVFKAISALYYDSNIITPFMSLRSCDHCELFLYFSFAGVPRKL